jgi:hypothetical protein
MNEIAALNADVVNSSGPALSATSDYPTQSQLDVATSPKPEKAAAETKEDANPAKDTQPAEPKVDDIIAEPGEIDPNKLRKSALQERFRELTTAQKEAMERASRAEAALKAIEDARAKEAAEAEARKLGAPKPTRDKFDDPDAYDAALVEWAQNQGKKQGLTEAQQAAQRESNERSQREAQSAFQERVAAFKTEVPDFETLVMQNPDLQISAISALTIQKMENGPAVAYHLAKNPQLAAKIAAMSPPDQVFEMGKLSASVTTPQRSNASRAPAPISPVGSRSGVSKSPDQMSGDEYYAARMAERRAARN